MKKVDKKNLNLAIEYYINQAKKSNIFFDGSLENEIKYLEHHKNRYFIILKKIENLDLKKSISVLEIGFSPMSFILKYFLNNEKLTVLDHNAKLGDRIKKIGVNFIYCDLTKKKFIDKKYDLIIFNEVMEHIFSDESVLLSSLINKIKKNGYLIITTPNYFSLKNILLFFLGKNLNPMFKDILKSDGSLHVREYSNNEILELLSKINRIDIVYNNFERYFEGIKTLLVYRKHKFLSFFPIAFYSLITLLVPRLRIGLCFIVRRIK